jgi:hypothetical protein
VGHAHRTECIRPVVYRCVNPSSHSYNFIRKYINYESKILPFRDFFQYFRNDPRMVRFHHLRIPFRAVYFIFCAYFISIPNRVYFAMHLFQTPMSSATSVL